MLLSNLFDNAPEIDIDSLCNDSRLASKGCMFFCLEGIVTDGHKYIEEAIKKGAVCVVYNKEIVKMQNNVVYLKVDNVAATLNRVCNRFYGCPTHKLKVVGVTGTNGKTVVSRVIAQIYNNYESCGYIGSLNTQYAENYYESPLTTPDVIYLHSTAKDMVDANVKVLSLEVSSHGLEQSRVDSIDFNIGIFTNISNDTLDYHGSLANYLKAKKKLFMLLKPDAIAVFNADDEKFLELVKDIKCDYLTYGIDNKADFRATDIKLQANKTTFNLEYNEANFMIKTNFIGRSNVYNILAAIAGLVSLGLSIEEIMKHLVKLEKISGRYEMIDRGQPFRIYVDFARTVEGFRKIHEFARDITPKAKKIITLFGTPGRKDKQKRVKYGEICSEFSNMVILTEDDSRDESLRSIVDDIKKGINNVNHIFIEDRYDAIRQAIELANPNDTILILGKGDENSILKEFGREEWMGDSNAVVDILDRFYLGDEDNE